jgi:hypothetical protein
MQRKASELKRAIRSAIAKETEPEEGEISIAGRQFRPIKERSKHGQPIYQEVGRNFFISPDVGSGDGGGAHIGGVWKGAASAAGLRSKTTRMGTYDANLNKIGG